ncbi:uncharacterized protein EAF01_011613 [Botrytis porri]|uniref:Uncharacterized protein n=1 Tax=Botrytis porri TaxID=87229 RepID=A0A4Z1KF57_9HELO|nr:uncharacterized protein EAF01_011613 [Botrytis porri]KAF7883104.1 hypothetical protein EAF01_011613 [Botrytis porri]TGO80067.1 hypothetical protein BPOR_1825g00010 [Botrytis porri]
MPPVRRRRTPREKLLAYNQKNAENPTLIYKGERCPDAKICVSSHVMWIRGENNFADAVVVSGPNLAGESQRERIVVAENATSRYHWHTYFVRYMHYGETQSRVSDRPVAEADLVERAYPNPIVDRTGSTNT